MNENQNNVETDCKTENSCLMQQLSDDLQRIVIEQMDYQNGLGTIESSDAMISCNNNNDLKVSVGHLHEGCEFKNMEHGSKNTDFNMWFDFGEDMDSQNSEDQFMDLPSISKNQVDTKASKKEMWPEENQQDTDIQSTKNDYDPSTSTHGCFAEHASEIQNRRNTSYSNSIKRYCYKCKLVSNNIIDSKCYSCQSSLQFQCEKCGNLYKNYIAILSHIKYECYKLPTFYCPTCSYTSYRKISLLNHMHTQHSSFNKSKYSNECSMCKKNFRDQQHKLRHERTCNNNSNLMCQHCPYKTKLQELLSLHMQKKHQQYISSSHKCPDCNKKYKDLKTLHLHMKFTCSIKKFFQCDYCHFKTDNKFSLTQHVQGIHRFFLKRMNIVNN